MNHKSNHQYQKTETALKEALIDLLKVKSLDKITVTELTEKADVHRGTFYIHYKDVYDLFGSIENDFFTKTEVYYLMYVAKAKVVDLEKLFKNIYKLFTDNMQVTRIMLDRGSFDFNEVFIFVKTNKYRGPENFKEWHSMYNIGDKDSYMYFFTSLVSAFNAIIFTWFKNGLDKNPDEMTLIVKTIFEVFGFKKPFIN